jgi:uncharacterized protein YeaO (DUF488 family)
MIKLQRAQIGRSAGLDTTVKSSTGWAKDFAPTWDMVMGHKRGKVSDEQYTEQYLAILAHVPVPTWREFAELGRRSSNRITLLCYCPDGKFCHTHLMIDYIVGRWPHLFTQ